MKITELSRLNIHGDEIEEIFVYPDEIVVKLRRDNYTLTNQLNITPDVRLISNEGQGYNINTTLKTIWKRD